MHFGSFRLVMDGTMSGKLDEGLLDRRRVSGLRGLEGAFALAKPPAGLPSVLWKQASHSGLSNS